MMVVAVLHPDLIVAVRAMAEVAAVTVVAAVDHHTADRRQDDGNVSLAEAAAVVVVLGDAAAAAVHDVAPLKAEAEAHVHDDVADRVRTDPLAVADMADNVERRHD